MKDDPLKLTFTPWTRWRDRLSLVTHPSQGGVYVFGLFRSPPPGPPSADNLPLEVIYVGDARNLNHRPLTERHHKIVKRLPALFPGPALDSLFVSVCPLYVTPTDFRDDLKAAQQYAVDRTRSFYIESWLAWKYADRYEHPPIMQVKDAEWNEGWIDKVVRKLKVTRMRILPGTQSVILNRLIDTGNAEEAWALILLAAREGEAELDAFLGEASSIDPPRAS
jgi:hypothetical protein